MAPTAADRTRKMEMRQEAAAVAAANAAAAAAAVISAGQSAGNVQGATVTDEHNTADIMLSMAMGDGEQSRSTGTGAMVAAAASVASPATPRARGKGKWRDGNLGPAFGIQKARRPVAASPVGVMSAGSAATSGATVTPLAPRPPPYPLSSSPPSLDATDSPLSSSSPATGTRPPAGRYTSALPAGLSEAGSPMDTAGSLGTRTATVAGFVVGSTPTTDVTKACEGARRKCAITAASPVVSGVRRRTHRVPAARLARQLEAAGATAAAKRLDLSGGSADGAASRSFMDAGSSSNVAGVRPSSPAPAAHSDEASEGPAATRGGMSIDNAGIINAGAATNDVNGDFLGVDHRHGAVTSGVPRVAQPSTSTAGWVEVVSAADASDSGSAPPCPPRSTSLSGSVGGFSTPGTSDVESPPPSPSRPLTWRSNRSIPSPVVRFPLATTPPPPQSTLCVQGGQTMAAGAAVEGMGPSASRLSKVIDNAIRASTADLRIDVASLCARTNEAAMNMKTLMTKVDTTVNLTQQTLVAVRKVEAAVKVAVDDVIKKGSISEKEDAETAKQRTKTLLEDVKVSFSIGPRRSLFSG